MQDQRPFTAVKDFDKLVREIVALTNHVKTLEQTKVIYERITELEKLNKAKIYQKHPNDNYYNDVVNELKPLVRNILKSILTKSITNTEHGVQDTKEARQRY